MRHRRGWMTATVLIAGLALAHEARGLSLAKVNLDDLCQRAGRIFRGTVLERTEGSIAAGGGRVPVTTYAVRVDEAFKGPLGSSKPGAVVELRMLGESRPVTVGSMRSVAVARDLPRLEVGGSYLLFSTQPSAIGLSTTVGFGQGLFRVSGAPGHEKVVNGFDNLGLFETMSGPSSTASRGPIAYDRMAAAIRSALAGN